MSDQLNPPAKVDCWWAVKQKQGDCERHHYPNERPVQRCDLGHTVPRVEQITDPARSHPEKQKHGGPSKGDTKVNEDAEQSREHSSLERLFAQRHGSDFLKQAHYVRMVEYGREDTREESVGRAGEKARAHQPGEIRPSSQRDLFASIMAAQRLSRSLLYSASGCPISQ